MVFLRIIVVILVTPAHRVHVQSDRKTLLDKNYTFKKMQITIVQTETLWFLALAVELLAIV